MFPSEFTKNYITFKNYTSKNYEKEFIGQLKGDLDIGFFVEYLPEDIKAKNFIKGDAEIANYLVLINGEYVGIMAISIIDGISEIKYAVHPKYRKISIGTLMLKAMCEYLKEKQKEVTEINLTIEPINEGSVRVAEANNFSFEEETRNGHFEKYIKKLR